MALRELNTVPIRRCILIQNDVLAKGNLPVLPNLLEPGQTVHMRREACDDIVQPVPIHIVNDHLRSASSERSGMPNPNRVSGQRSRLFPPGVFLQNVDLAITIHIATAETMGEPLPISFRCNRMKCPWGAR